MAQQQQFRLQVDARAPGRRVEPGPADLDHPVGWAHRQETRAAGDGAAAKLADREDPLPGLGLRLQGEREPLVEALAAGVEVGEPLPDLRCLRR
jgi:hypothetical protein